MKLSIIIPVYNVKGTLERCVDSVLAQKYHDYQLILVNDGSTDGSQDICNKYMEQEHRIQVIHKENGGLSDARNAGLDVAKGDYFFLVDSDDWIHKQTIEIMMQMIEKNNCDVAICGYQYAYEGKEYSDKELDLNTILDQYKNVNRYRAQEIYFTNP